MKVRFCFRAIKIMLFEYRELPIYANIHLSFAILKVFCID